MKAITFVAISLFALLVINCGQSAADLDCIPDKEGIVPSAACLTHCRKQVSFTLPVYYGLICSKISSY